MSPAASSLPRPPRVEVWHDTIDRWRTGDARSRAESWLTGAERGRYTRFLHDDDRLMFLVGRVMARALVGKAIGCEPTAWRWREGPHGRPEIDEPGVSCRFNVAHSAGLVVCAMADGHDVGVDVEDLGRRPVSAGFARRYLSPGEVDDVESLPAPAQQMRLLTYWTLKEAYLKARGLGVSVPLSDIEFTLATGVPRIAFRDSLAGTSTDWHFHLEQSGSRHLMAVASNGPRVFATGLAFAEADAV